MIKRYIALVLAVTAFAGCAFSCSKKDANSKKPSEEAINYYDFEMTDYINVPSLEEVVIPLSEIDKEWEYTCLKVRLDSTEFKKVEDPQATVELYDKVTIDCDISENTKNELPQELQQQLVEQNLELIIGSGDLVAEYVHASDSSKNTDSFESQLIGAKAGQTVDVTVTFADDFRYTDSKGVVHSAMAGVRVEFIVTVKSIQRGEVPELTNSLITNYTSSVYLTIDEYKKFTYDYYKGTYAYNYFYKATSLKGGYPEQALNNARLIYITNTIDARYPEAELDDEDITTLYDSLYDEANEYAKQAVFERMVLEYLFKVCNISLTDDGYLVMLRNDYDASYYYYYMMYGVTTMSEYEEYFGKENLVLQYKYEKLLNVLPTMVTFR